MAPKSQPKKIVQAQDKGTPSTNGPPKQMTDYTSFESEKLSISPVYKTKYNAQAKLKYDGDEFLLRTPFMKRCFLNKFESGHAQMTFSLDYEGPSFHDTLKEIGSVVIQNLTDRLVEQPIDNKRKHEDYTDPSALRAELEEQLKPMIIADNPDYPNKLRSEIAVVNPDTKKLTPAADCKIFLTELDGKSKLIDLREMSDYLEDRQFFYQVRAVLHFTHVYMGNKGSKDIGIKHCVKALQLKQLDMGDRQAPEPLALDVEQFLT